MESQKKKSSAGFKKALAVVLMGTVCLTAAVSVGSLSKKVTVTDGNETVTIDTINPDTDAILAKTGVQLGENDKLVRTESSEDGVNISIVRAFDVEASDSKVSYDETSVADSLFSAGMTLSANDSISLAAALESSGAETEVKLSRVEITVNDKGEEFTKFVPAGTVKEALDFLDIKLSDIDEIDVDTAKAVEDGMKITITGVKYETVTNFKTIDFETVYQDSDSLYVGETEVQTVGQEGKRTVVTKKKYVNDVFDSEEVVSDTITAEPVTQVILQGTKEYVEEVNTYTGTSSVDYSSQTITDAYGRTYAYSYVLSGPATAYYAPAGALTSTGRLARYGVVAVDPDEIPYGSILYIVADDGTVYGYAVAGDTGGFIYYTDVLVDVFFPTFDQCCNWGLKNVSVYVLEGASEDLTY